VIPWAQLSIGFGMALGLCLLAALWPAILTGRAEPLKLLQAGRAALYARFLESQRYSQDDPWKERAEGKDAHEYAALATIA